MVGEGGVWGMKKGLLSGAFNPLRGQATERTLPAPNYGYGGPFGFWQQSRDPTASEEIADNFIRWAYNYWGGGPAGEMRANWMNNFMSVAIDMARGR